MFGGSYGYTGFARPETVRRDRRRPRLPRHDAAVRRFFVLRPPRGTGPIAVRERAADGRVVAHWTLRN